MVELTELLHPTAAEAQARRTAVSQVEAVVKSIWPAAEVQVFGSFATGTLRHVGQHSRAVIRGLSAGAGVWLLCDRWAEPCSVGGPHA